MEVKEELKYENKIMCKRCGGACYQRMGCHFSSDDFELLNKSDSIDVIYERHIVVKNYLKEELDKGYISIDWWEGDIFFDKTYFLRMRNKNANIVDPSWGGICEFWNREYGCPIEFEKRPKGARMLIPNKNGCIQQYTKEQCVRDWKKYHDIIEELVAVYKL